MVRTRGGSLYRPRVRFSTPEMEDPGTSGAVSAHSPTYLQLHSLHWPQQPYMRSLRDFGDTRLEWDLGPLPRYLRDDAGGPALQAGLDIKPGESSRSRPEPSPSPADEGSSSQLSPASRIRHPLFTGDPIPGNVDLRARDFHKEPYYYLPALTTDPWFRDSMRLITQYSLLPFMTPR